MITKDKFALNLKELKNRIPSKPKIYTKEHPKTIKEAVKYYCNQRTVHTIQTCTNFLHIENWPLPLWFNPENIKVGFWNYQFYKKQYNASKTRKKFKGLKGFDFVMVPVMNSIFFKQTIDDIISEAFDANLKFAFESLQSNPILHSKEIILKSIKNSYRKSNWVACISTIFPLIDFVVRKILKTNNLRIDVSKICKLFEQNGFSLENAGDLMPYQRLISSYNSDRTFSGNEREEWFNKMLEFDFGILGPALSSFIRFANTYYSFYREDQESQVEQFNRHAIIHGSTNQFGTKVNTIKLLTFLYLILELEDAFEILFNE